MTLTAASRYSLRLFLLFLFGLFGFVCRHVLEQRFFVVLEVIELGVLLAALVIVGLDNELAYHRIAVEAVYKADKSKDAGKAITTKNAIAIHTISVHRLFFIPRLTRKNAFFNIFPRDRLVETIIR